MSEDAVELLLEDHRDIEKKLSTLMECKENERQTLFDSVGDELALHVAMEEDVFYPAVRAKRTEDILLESLEEHLSLKRVLSDLLRLNATDKAFEPKLHVLKEQVEHHHKEEEEHLFPKVKKLLSKEELVSLKSEMLTLKTKLAASDAPRERVRNQTREAASLEPAQNP